MGNGTAQRANLHCFLRHGGGTMSTLSSSRSRGPKISSERLGLKYSARRCADSLLQPRQPQGRPLSSCSPSGTQPTLNNNAATWTLMSDKTSNLSPKCLYSQGILLIRSQITDSYLTKSLHSTISAGVPGTTRHPKACLLVCSRRKLNFVAQFAFSASTYRAQLDLVQERRYFLLQEYILNSSPSLRLEAVILHHPSTTSRLARCLGSSPCCNI